LNLKGVPCDEVIQGNNLVSSMALEIWQNRLSQDCCGGHSQFFLLSLPENFMCETIKEWTTKASITQLQFNTPNLSAHCHATIVTYDWKDAKESWMLIRDPGMTQATTQ
jgi:hypothetical protein